MEVFQSDLYPEELGEVYPIIERNNLLKRYSDANRLIESELGIEVSDHEALELEEGMAGISENYIERLRRTEDPEELEARIEGEMVTAGGTLKTMREALEGENSCFIGGGAHHAAKGESSSYNLFNDIIIGLETVREESEIGNVSIIDLDVHHPDGTAKMYRLDPDVQIFSMHGWGIFPGTGWMHDNGTGESEGTHINVPLPDKTSGEKYNEILERSLEKAIEHHEPDFVIYVAGADVYSGDDLGNLDLNTEEVYDRDKIVRDIVGDIPMATLAGGGYSARTPEIYANTVAALSGEESIMEEEREFRDEAADEKAEDWFQDLSDHLERRYDLQIQ